MLVVAEPKDIPDTVLRILVKYYHVNKQHDYNRVVLQVTDCEHTRHNFLRTGVLETAHRNIIEVSSMSYWI